MPAVSYTDLGHDLYLIDAYLIDEPRRLACYLFDTPERVLVDCGPSHSIGHLFAALDHLGIDEVATLAVTHIHLDHAGGAGHFAARFPRARVAVHSLGLPHLAAPARLIASATRAFGEQSMRDHWGTVDPVDPSRLVALDEGSRLPLGAGRSLEVMYTPGHARHHVVFFEGETGACLVGDEAGVAFPHSHAVQPATPAPDFDAAATVEQLRRIAARRPSLLGLAHFGPHPDPLAALAEAERRVLEWVSWVEHANGGNDLAGSFRDWVLDAHRARGVPEDEVARYDRHTVWATQVEGIRRWLDRRPPPA
jgi:glyoxylase-like metal-dependent hydrolase (beta-lactamase superfamily II)